MGYYDVYHRAEVLATRRLTPHLVRVELGGDGLRTWRVQRQRPTSGWSLVLPPPGSREAAPPVTMPDGTQDYPDPDDQPPMRSYTVRSWDAEPARMVRRPRRAPAAGVASTWATHHATRRRDLPDRGDGLVPPAGRRDLAAARRRPDRAARPRPRRRGAARRHPGVRARRGAHRGRPRRGRSSARPTSTWTWLVGSGQRRRPEPAGRRAWRTSSRRTVRATSGSPPRRAPPARSASTCASERGMTGDALHHSSATGASTPSAGTPATPRSPPPSRPSTPTPSPPARRSEDALDLYDEALERVGLSDRCPARRRETLPERRVQRSERGSPEVALAFRERGVAQGQRSSRRAAVRSARSGGRRPRRRGGRR